MEQLHRVAEFQQFSTGRLFCFKVAQVSSEPYKAVLIVPPFAEEMNKSRKMMTHLLDEIASDSTEGYLFDLYGTGDSEGEFNEGTWDIWRKNLLEMINFVANQPNVKQISIVAIRTGALLINSILSDASVPKSTINAIHYWNPVFNASLFINQFLRLKLAANMMRSQGAKETVKTLRQVLLEQGELEVAGYMLNSLLIDGMEATKITLSPCYSEVRLHFYELSNMATITPGLSKKIDEFHHLPDLVFTYALEGVQFWGTQEITLCEPLLALTKANLAAD